MEKWGNDVALGAKAGLGSENTRHDKSTALNQGLLEFPCVCHFRVAAQQSFQLSCSISIASLKRT